MPPLFLTFDIVADPDAGRRGIVTAAWARGLDQTQWIALDPGFDLSTDILRQAQLMPSAPASEHPDPSFVAHHIAREYPGAKIVTYWSHLFPDIVHDLLQLGHEVVDLFPAWAAADERLAHASLDQVYQSAELGPRQIPRVAEHLFALRFVYDRLTGDNNQQIDQKLTKIAGSD